MTLRLRILLTVVGLALAGLLIAGIVTYLALQSFLIDRVDRQLWLARNATAVALRTGISFPQITGSGGRHDDSLLPPGTYGELRDADGATLSSLTFSYGDRPDSPPDLPARLSATSTPQDGSRLTVDSQDGDSRYRVLVSSLRGSGSTLIVAIPLVDVDDTLGQVFWIEFLVITGVVVALGAGAWFLVRRELRPLDEMAAAAGEIAGGDLARRVEPADSTTEVGRLGLALNEMLGRIEQAFAAQEASEQRLRRFLADASHELRTPLTSIRGYSELFRRGADSRPADLETAMRRIEEEARRMGVLVDDLLLLARLDADRPLARDSVDLVGIVTDAAHDARAADPDRTISLDTPSRLTLIGDADRLRQVVANLLANALRHTPAGTPIEMSLATSGDWAALSVRDHGPGLPPDALDKVFEPFSRLDASRGRATGGAGLGLAIVKAVVEAHGGRVDAVTPQDGGASFTVRLPLTSQASAHQEASPPLPPR